MMELTVSALRRCNNNNDNNNNNNKNNNNNNNNNNNTWIYKAPFQRLQSAGTRNTYTILIYKNTLRHDDIIKQYL